MPRSPVHKRMRVRKGTAAVFDTRHPDPEMFMNYCPVCKREYKQLTWNQTGLCPTCGTRLQMISDEDLEQVRKKNRKP